MPKVTPIVIPTPDGPVETVVITAPASAFADLKAWEALGAFGPVRLDEPDLS